MNGTTRVLVEYRLPNGAIVLVDDSAAKGAPTIDYTLKGGYFVMATRVMPRPTSGREQRFIDEIATLKGQIAELEGKLANEQALTFRLMGRLDATLEDRQL